MATGGKGRRRRATKIKYVVSIPGSVPADLEQKISDAHARVLLAAKPWKFSDQPKEKSSDGG